MPTTALPLVISSLTVAAVGALVIGTHGLGSLSTGMAVHIGLMNVVAPLGAVLLPTRPPARPIWAWSAAGVQIVMLWTWHAPSVHQHAANATTHHTLSLGVLFVAALLFWWSLLRLATDQRWHGIAILMLTGKLFCLLGVLLIFAPQPLFDAPLADQQLAGLLMITACPLSYLVAGVIIAAQVIDSHHIDLTRSAPLKRPGAP